MRREFLPDAEIDRLFTRLLVRYGGPFSDRWRMLDLKVVKADWARELGRFGRRPEAIAWALEHLPERPPSVIDFARLCEQAPQQAAPPASAKPTRGPNPFEREQLRSLREQLPTPNAGTARPDDETGAARRWAPRLLRRHERGEFVATPAALAMARDALGLAAPAGGWTHDQEVREMRERELIAAGCTGAAAAAPAGPDSTDSTGTDAKLVGAGSQPFVDDEEQWL